MPDFIDYDARRRIAQELRLALTREDAVSRIESLRLPRTKDKALHAVLSEACDTIEDAALRVSESEIAHVVLPFADEEKEHLEHLILFLESDKEMANDSMKLCGRNLWIAIGAYLALLACFTYQFWCVEHELVVSVGISILLATFVYAIGVLVVMVASSPLDWLRSRKQREELQSLGVNDLWPFASVSDLTAALEGRRRNPTSKPYVV